MRRGLAGAVAASVIAGCAVSPATTGSGQAGEALTAAEGYFALDEPLAARSVYEEVLATDPDNPVARLGLARIAFVTGDHPAVLREVAAAEASPLLTAAEREAGAVLRGRALARSGSPAPEVWAALYPVWRAGGFAVKTSLAAELKALARDLEPDVEGRAEVLAFVPPRRGASAGIDAAEAPPPAPGGRDAAAAGTILPRSSWQPELAVRRSDVEPMEKPYRITLHHSAHDDVVASRSTEAAADLIRRIQRYHIEHNGWGDIGYHFIIDGSGQIWEGRSLAYQGAHAGGESNRGNIGIAVIGDFENGRPDRAQVASLTWLVQHLRSTYGIAQSRIYGHWHFKATECPGRSMRPILRALNPHVAH
jgi:hypothetical protein